MGRFYLIFFLKTYGLPDWSPESNAKRFKLFYLLSILIRIEPDKILSRLIGETYY